MSFSLALNGGGHTAAHAADPRPGPLRRLAERISQWLQRPERLADLTRPLPGERTTPRTDSQGEDRT